MDYFKIGKIVNTHGIKGMIKIYPYTENIHDLDNIKQIYLNPELQKKYTVKSVNAQKNMLLMSLEGIDTQEEAETLKNEYLYIPRDPNEKLQKDTYYICDIIGCDVISIDDNSFVGKIVDVFNTGANDIYEVKTENSSICLPAIFDVIKKIDIKQKKVYVHMMEGLM